MKNIRIHILALTALCLAFSLSAQVKVRSNGNVQIGPTNLQGTGADLEIIESGKTTETRLYVQSANTARYWALNSLYAYGFGIDNSGVGHIWKNINGPSALMTFNSRGNVGLSMSPFYRLDVNGTVRAFNFILGSDAQLKTDIEELDAQTASLSDLRGVQYHLKAELEQVARAKTEAGQSDFPSASDYKFNSENLRHFGFIAQEVREVYPELVYEDGEGVLGVDYIGFIPLLVEALQDQRAELAELKSELEALKQGGAQFAGLDKGAVLFQNHPNPFSHSTEIKYILPEARDKGEIMVFDLQGNFVKSYVLEGPGENSVTIDGGTLKPGMYLYSLIVNGEEVSTKRMILTK